MADMSLDEALGLTGAEAADDSIHIDVNTRQVTVPESQRLFGVESDENVEVKHIVLDGRYNDGTDLSTLTLRVNWRNANGGKGSYLVTNLDVTEDSIAFDWVISRGVVAYKGTVYFIVCAFKVNSTGKTEQEWNSSLGQGTVLEGLEVTDEDIGGDDTVNRMLTILQQMNSVQTAAKNSADAAAASSKSASDTAGSIKDSLDQIAENKAGVSQLKENTAKLKDGKISKFYASSQGNTNLPDSDDGRIMDLMLYGKSEQKQYSGKNLYNKSTSISAWISDTDGNVDDRGNLGSANDICSNFISVSEGKSYICSFQTGYNSNKIYWRFYNADKNFMSFENSKNTATIPAGACYIRVLISMEKDWCVVVNDELQIELGSTATAYEPYVGGIPSPNPEYPQEIKSVVKPVVKVCGKNLAKLSGTSISDKRFYSILLVKGQQYTFSSALKFNGYVGIYSAVDAAEPIQDILKWGAYNSPITFTSDSNGKCYLCVWYTSAHIADESALKVMLEQGSTVTDYQPYTEQTVTLPYTLNAIPVSSGGNVTIDGQQYIADYVDVEKGKLVRMVDSSKLDTTQSIIGKTDWLLATPTEIDLTADEIAAFKALVSHYPVTNVSTTSDQLDGYTVFDYPISLANGWNYVKQQIGDTRDYLYGIDLMTAEAYVNSEYAAALAEIEV